MQFSTLGLHASSIHSGGGAGGQRGQLPLQLEDQQLRRNFGRKIFDFSYSSMTVFTRTINKCIR